jgi:hypothetical protein
MFKLYWCPALYFQIIWFSCILVVRRVWRYKRGNRNPYIEEEDNAIANGTEMTRFFRYPALFSYSSSSTKCSTVVQVPWLLEVTEGHVTLKRFPWKGVRMCNQKLRNIRHIGAFSLKKTSSNVTSPEVVPLEGWGEHMRNQK